METVGTHAIYMLKSSLSMPEERGYSLARRIEIEYTKQTNDVTTSRPLS